MANAHELACGHKRLRALIEFVVGEGWHVKRTPGGHLVHQGRLRGDLHQFDRERPPGRIERPCADPLRRARGSAWRRPAVGTARGAMADMTSQDMAGKLLAAGFERSGPAATA